MQRHSVTKKLSSPPPPLTTTLVVSTDADRGVATCSLVVVRFRRRYDIGYSPLKWLQLYFILATLIVINEIEKIEIITYFICNINKIFTNIAN